MRHILLLLSLLIFGTAAASESDSIYATAMKMVAAERETEARQLLSRCLELEPADCAARRNVGHWIDYLRNRALDADTVYHPEFNFTPLDRSILREYLALSDRIDSDIAAGRTAEAHSGLQQLYRNMCDDPKITPSYRLDALLRLDVFERTNGLERTAVPLLDSYVRPDMDDSELGLELAGALYGAYGTAVFDHIDAEIFGNIGSGAIFSSLFRGLIKESIDWLEGFTDIITKAYGPNSYESLPMLQGEYLIIKLAIPEQSREALLRDNFARTDSVLAGSISGNIDREKALLLAQTMIQLADNRHDLDKDDADYAEAMDKAMKFARKHHLDRDDRMLLYLAKYYEDTDPETSRRYAEEAFKTVLRNNIGGERRSEAAMRMCDFERHRGNFDKALQYMLQCSDANDSHTVDSITMRFYIDTPLFIDHYGDKGQKLNIIRKGLEASARIDAESETHAHMLAWLAITLVEYNLNSEARLALYRLNELCERRGYNIYRFIDRYGMTTTILNALGVEYDSKTMLNADMPLVEDAFGKYSSEYSDALFNLADEYIRLEDYDRGLSTYRRCIEIDSIVSGIFYDPRVHEKNLIYYEYKRNPSDSLAESARTRLEELAAEMKDETESIKGRQSFLSLCEYRILFALIQDDYHAARSISEEKLALLSENSSAYLNTLEAIVQYSSYLNDHDHTYSLMPRYIAAFRQQTMPPLVLMTDEERTSFWPQRSKEIGQRVLFPLFLGGGDRFAGFAYDNALLNKGLLLQSARVIDKALANEPQLQAELTSVVAAQKNETDPETSRQLYIREKEILAGIASRTEWGQFLNMSWRDVAAALPDTAIAIEFCAVNPDEHARYGALVVASGEEPQFIDLFRIKNFRNAADRYAFFTDSIWAPVLSRFPTATEIYFSPVGELCRQPVEAAPVPGDTITPMCERYAMHRLTSTRELALKPRGALRSKGVAMGGLKYDMDADELTDDSRHYAPSDLKKRGAVRDFYSTYGLEYLPGTEREVSAVGRLAHDAKVDFSIITGTDGTEARFKSLSGDNNNIIHIATHGFYWTEEEARYMPKFDYLFRDLHTPEDRSLARSGLMLAGANRAYKGMEIDENAEDGILTAREIADLDLSAADFVILSACNTGLGDVSPEGVFGLQRGFKKAGVNAMMLSLWKVADGATAMLMDRFYTAYFGGKSKTESLRTAQHALRTYTAPDGSHPYASPAFWAPFILLDAR